MMGLLDPVVDLLGSIGSFVFEGFWNFIIAPILSFLADTIDSVVASLGFGSLLSTFDWSLVSVISLLGNITAVANVWIALDVIYPMIVAYFNLRFAIMGFRWFLGILR